MITFFASIQYVFIGAVSDDYSPFGFQCITNLIGFVIMVVMFFGTIVAEMYRLTKSDILHGIILSLERTGFTTLSLIGVSGSGATVSACILSSYFVFIPVIAFVAKREKPKKGILIASVLAVIGLGMVGGFDVGAFFDIHTLALIAADICFALYIYSVGKFTTNTSPTFLAIGQMLWCSVITLALWGAQSLIMGQPMSLPSSPAFMICLFYVGIFLKGIYTISQIHAQRYISPIDTSLIFSTEIIMTMVFSPLLAYIFDIPKEDITVLRVLGGLLVILGILIADEKIYIKITSVFKRKKEEVNT